jgi:transposase
MSRLHVGIDPAQKDCVASLVDESGKTLGKALHFEPNRSGVAGFVRRVQKEVPGAECHYFVEASGLSWYAPSALLREAGQLVSLINPSYTKAQRKVSSRYAKSDAKDADAIARAPFNMGEKAYHPADIPEGPRLNLRMLCRHRHTLQEDATAIKLRVLAWLGLTTPGLCAVLGSDLSAMDREFIRRYPVVARIQKLGPARVQQFLERRCEGELDDATVDELFKLAREAYQPKEFDDQLMALQIGMELDRLALLEKQIAKLDKQIEKLYPTCDPEGLAKSLPGFGKVVAPILVAEAGTDMTRFATVDRFASWTGLVARASGSAGKQQEGLPMTKAGRSIVKWALHMAANSAIQRDPELREFYDRLRGKDKHHNAALTAVAHKLANRYWAVMREQRPYVKRVPATTAGAEEATETAAGAAAPVDKPVDNLGINPPEIA